MIIDSGLDSEAIVSFVATDNYLGGQLIKMDVRDAEPGESAGSVKRPGVDDDGAET